jgi:hypothetical protein
VFSPSLLLHLHAGPVPEVFSTPFSATFTHHEDCPFMDDMAPLVVPCTQQYRPSLGGDGGGELLHVIRPSGQPARRSIGAE